MSNPTPTNLFRPTRVPTVWNGEGRYMLPTRFAVWFPNRGNYQVYEVNRENYPVIQLNPSRTARQNPFYFAELSVADHASRSILMFRPRARVHTHVQMGIWFTGGWLCKQNGHNLEPVIPIMGISDTRNLTYEGNIGIVWSTEFENWVSKQSSALTAPIIRNRVFVVDDAPAADDAAAPTTAPTTAPTPIPKFVAETLIAAAKQKNEACPITMEAFTECASLSVTSCFHIFARDALDAWFHSNKGASCPVCKSECAITNV